MASDVFDPNEVGTSALPARPALLSLIGHPGLRDVRSKLDCDGASQDQPEVGVPIRKGELLNNPSLKTALQVVDVSFRGRCNGYDVLTMKYMKESAIDIQA